MSPRKLSAIVPDAMSELNRMIKKGEREIKTRKARTGDRGAIRDKRNEKRARLDGPDGPRVRKQYDWPDDPDDDCYHWEENIF